MFDAGRFRIHHRSMLVVAAVSLFLLVGLVGVVLVNGSSSPPVRSSNVSAECDTPTGPTARGYGETGTGVTGANPDCHPDCDSAAGGPTARGYGESGAASDAPIGMIDGGVAAHPALAGASIRQRGFAAGGPKGSGHGTAIASLLVGRDGSFKGAATGRVLLAADVYGGNPAAGLELRRLVR